MIENPYRPVKSEVKSPPRRREYASFLFGGALLYLLVCHLFYLVELRFPPDTLTPYLLALPLPFAHVMSVVGVGGTGGKLAVSTICSIVYLGGFEIALSFIWSNKQQFAFMVSNFAVGGAHGLLSKFIFQHWAG